MRLLLEKIRKILRDRRARQMLTRIVSSLAAVVVFVTTYALVLPAITMESQAACGILAHQHDDSCYEEVLVCGLPEGDGHTHTDACYTVVSELACGLQEHQHADGCYDADGNLICGMTDHLHEDNCYQENRTLTCGLEEAKGHHHNASCYEKQLVCGMEAHTHSTACYSHASGNGTAGSSAKDYAVVAATTEAADGAASGAGNTGTNRDGSTDAAAEAGTDLSALPAAEDAYVPELETLFFDQLLTKKTGIYYFHPEEGKTIPENSADITDWTRVDDDTDLDPNDILRVYLRYTIPAGSLNSTNPVARYRLPANLHLTDQQMEEINTNVNGIANQYVNLDTLEILDPDQYNQYLGIEAVEGTRTPADDINEYFDKHPDMNGQEYINATVQAENVYDTEGLYGEKDAYLGQDLIFTFTPYTIQKNQNEYDSDGQPTKAGEKVQGWVCLDVKMDQVDWGEAVVTAETVEEEAQNTGADTGIDADADANVKEVTAPTDKTTIEQNESAAEVIFAAEDKALKIDEISTNLLKIERTENTSDNEEVDKDQDEDTALNAENGDDTDHTDASADEDAENSDQASPDEKSREEGADETDDAAAVTDSATEINAETYPAASFEDSIVVHAGTLSTDNGSAAKDTPEETTIAVSVTADAETFPRGTTMVLGTVDDMDTVASAVEGAVEGRTRGFHAVDICFFDPDGNEIEPLKPIRVNMTSEAIKQAVEDAYTVPLVVHVENPANMQTENPAETVAADHTAADQPAGSAAVSPADSPVAPSQTEAETAALTATIVESNETAGTENAAAGKEPADTLSFDAGSFSVYAIVYTVDFHYEVDGKTYDFSLPGGGFVRFTDLVELLGIMGNTDNGDKDNGKNGKIEENGAQIDVVEAKVTDGMLDVAPGDAAKKFAADVASVVFSSPDLVDVSKVENEISVGQVKENRGLACQYSADLTDEQIARINAQTLEAGDWVLISMQPFMSEEALTVTMRNGEAFTIRVTDAQISTHVITAEGERFRITVTYEEDAKIPAGSVLAAEEIPEGSEKYEQYLEETARKWEEADRDEYINFARFFDIEIRKDGAKIEPEAPVEVEIVHDDGLALFEEEGLSVIHFAEGGTEIIDEIHRNEDSTQVVYEQDGFSVIGTVSTVKNSGWPTVNGQYVLVLQDGDDYYALKQDGTLAKVRYFNNTVSFIGEGTTTVDYINEYLWYVQSNSGANATGRISDKYYENGASVSDQMFIVPTQDGWLINSARQIRFNPAERKLYYTYYNVSRTLSAHNGQLRVVNLNDSNASPVFFASVSTFTANDNETDLFTQVEVESIIEKWKEQKTQEAVYDKTAEVYDYENRIYQVDISASSSDYEVAPSIALEFVVDASRSMFYPTKIEKCGTLTANSNTALQNWLNANGDINKTYFVVNNPNTDATQIALFYNPAETKYWSRVSGKWQFYEGAPYGVWEWTDASLYNPPDGDKAIGNVLDRWSYGNLDLNVYETDMMSYSYEKDYGTRGTYVSRIEYLKQCVRVASQVIYAVDDHAQIGLIGFNAGVTDYGTYGKNEQQTLLEKIDNISLAGGTDQEGGLEKAVAKFRDPQNAGKYSGRKHVVVLVTDGAPNHKYDSYDASRTTPGAHQVDWTSIGKVANKLKNLKDDFGNDTELYTMGLSLSNVGTNQSGLFGISSGAGYTYAAEDAAQIINAVTRMVDGIFVQANLVADVTDVIDPAFYPVNRANSLPLEENEWINLSGTKVNAGANDAAGQIKKDPSTGNWYVEWKDQSIDWPTTDSNGAVTAPGWHGTVFVKAKEDFLGGNGISTNAAGSQIEAKEFIVRGETAHHVLPEGDHTTPFETPFVNVDELDITKNDTEWTVYLGTNVDPLTEVKALWEKVMVREVVTKADPDHRISPDGGLTYQYASNTDDNRAEANGREEFPITDLEGFTISDDDWEDLIAGEAKIFDYNAYGHTKVGTIMVSLAKAVKTGEKDLTESPHDTTVTGDEVEKYTLTVSYRPVGANISNWHTGSYGSGMSGSRAGNILKNNTHIINVFVKGLQITKVDLDDRILTGAKFALYRTARDGETDLLEINGGQYHKIAELDTSATGIAVEEQIEQLAEGEAYYLVETQVPDGYNSIAPVPVSLSISDEYIPRPGTAAHTAKPETGIYDWTQKAALLLNAEAGVKRTNADNTVDLTHTGAANSNHEIIYYRIINNPGVELPSTGGPGTTLLYLLGFLLTALAGAGLMMKSSRRKNAA